MSSERHNPTTLSDGARVNARESRAKALYEIWQHRTGLESRAFEQLPWAQREAWLEIERDTISRHDPECCMCGGPLVFACVQCEGRKAE